MSTDPLGLADRNYHILEDRFVQLIQTVELSKDNLNTFGLKISNLIVEVVVEIENIIRAGAIRNQTNPHKVFQLLESEFAINQKVINLDPRYDSDIVFDNIFALEETSNPSKAGLVPVWWDAYNQIKHDRAKYLNIATLDVLTKSLIALYLILFIARFDTSEPGEIITIPLEFINSHRVALGTHFQGVSKYLKQYSKVFTPVAFIDEGDLPERVDELKKALIYVFKAIDNTEYLKVAVDTYNNIKDSSQPVTGKEVRILFDEIEREKLIPYKVQVVDTALIQKCLNSD
jgi:hypothetical protein